MMLYCKHSDMKHAIFVPMKKVEILEARTWNYFKDYKIEVHDCPICDARVIIEGEKKK